MDKPVLFAPWRMDYIRSLERPDEGRCIFCDAATATGDDLAKRLVLWTTPHSVVLMNKFPYTNGHLLIAPLAHKADLQDLSHDELCDLGSQTVVAVEVLKRAMSPQGFNIGINIGRCAGAGVPGHLHQHIVPRWSGDGNFMTVIGDIRIVPQALDQLYGELRKVAGELRAKT
jgi:ATP adenylyltransferase